MPTISRTQCCMSFGTQSSMVLKRTYRGRCICRPRGSGSDTGGDPISGLGLKAVVGPEELLILRIVLPHELGPALYADQRVSMV